MPKRHIEFEGLFAEGLLGVFRVIRGYADLRELAMISVPYTMDATDTDYGLVTGHQRAVSPRHARDIKRYLEDSDYRFLPEVILSVRVPVNLVVARGEIDPNEETLGLGEVVYGVESGDDALVRIRRRYRLESSRVQQLRIRYEDIASLQQDRVIRRIDGNHRLHLAERLADDLLVRSKYLAPFCMVLLGPPGHAPDDYAESLIFHTINSKALPLETEHGLRLLLGQAPELSMTPDNEFSYSPELHLTRLLANHMGGLPDTARSRFGAQPLTGLWESGRSLIAMDPSIATNRRTLTRFAKELFEALSDIVTMLTHSQPPLSRAFGFLELSARVWRQTEGADHEERVRSTVDYLDGLGHWLGSSGIADLLSPQSPVEVLLARYEAARSRFPKRVFLARWYPAEDAPDGAHFKAGLRLEQIQRTLEDIRQRHDVDLDLIDLGTEQGGTFAIHPRMYEAIQDSEIVVCDLTGQRPNVYVEAGFALGRHGTERLVFLFQPTCAHPEVPFDLTTFRHVRIGDAAEIPGKLGGEIEAILDRAGVGLGS